MKMLCCGALMTLMAMIAAPSSDAAGVMMGGRTLTRPTPRPAGIATREHVVVRNGVVLRNGGRVVFVPRPRPRVTFFFFDPFGPPCPVLVPRPAVFYGRYDAYPYPDSYTLGYDWARDLRQNIATWDGFVAYVKAYVLTAATKVQADFRRGFMNGYGVNARVAFDKAMSDAGARVPTSPSTSRK